MDIMPIIKAVNSMTNLIETNTAVFKATIPELFFRSANESFYKPAIYYKEEGLLKNITYGELSQKIVDLSIGLIKNGLQKGDKVAILSENRLEYYICELSVLSCGGIVVPLYINADPSQLETILKNSEAKFLFVSPQERILNKLPKINPNIGPKQFILTQNNAPNNSTSIKDLIDLGAKEESKEQIFLRLKDLAESDLAAIIYTSGTHTDPKGVMLTHANIISNAKGALEVLTVDRNSLNISLLPLSHALEKTCSFYIFLFQGAAIAICDNLNSLPETLREIAPTHIIGVPKLFESIYENIIKEINRKSSIKRKFFDTGIKKAIKSYKENGSKKPAGLASKLVLKTLNRFAFEKIKGSMGGKIKVFLSGGAALPNHISMFFNAIGIPLLESYGLTEASPVVSCNTTEKNKIGTVGHPLRNIQVMISQDGELLVKGPSVMKGYFKDEIATKEAIDEKGWLHTGDLGAIDEEGFITITGRK